MESILIDVDSVVFRDDLYPRLETSPQTVQKYAEDLSVLPPIEVNQHHELIDGWHRWTGHKKNGEKQIRAIITETTGDAHLLELAIKSNATHGLQLSQEDKKDMARRIYNGTPEKERATKKKELAIILSVSEKTVNNWLSNIDKDARDARNKRIFGMWLACYTQEEIAQAEGLPRQTVTDYLSGLAENGNVSESGKTEENDGDHPFKLSKSEKADAEHATDFDVPIYNIWSFQKKSNAVSHFGNTEARIFDNLLYLYTNPFDIVIDPFAGGGSTIDVCKKRFRRYLVSDRKPIVERASEIRTHDIKDKPLRPPQWKDVRLVYLDPPYWKQAENQYSEDADDLANMTLEDFNKSLSSLISEYAAKLKQAQADAVIALIIQPTHWNAPNRDVADHIADMIVAMSKKLTLHRRISCPYQTEQCTPQMVEWAKENKHLLVLTREVVVWRVQ